MDQEFCCGGGLPISFCRVGEGGGLVGFASVSFFSPRKNVSSRRRHVTETFSVMRFSVSLMEHGMLEVSEVNTVLCLVFGGSRRTNKTCSNKKRYWGEHKEQK